MSWKDLFTKKVPSKPQLPVSSILTRPVQKVARPVTRPPPRRSDR